MAQQSKAQREAFADGYQQALKDILKKKVMEGQPAADKWIEDNLIGFDEALNALHREQEYAWESEQDRRIAEHEADLMMRDLGY